MWLSRSVSEGLPVTDRGQAATLLRGRAGIQRVVALFEIADDTATVIDRIVIVVLEFRVDAVHRQAQPADAGEHARVRAVVDRDSGVSASGWKSPSCAARISTLPSASSTTVGRQTNCRAV
ncbi:hypothetical protein [Mycolicibacterium sp.]|uniref:hypothetical protein n=1 Tax=Mycolicibacterium sp. TaxID=2320850 RepID=UPI0037C70EFA